MKAINNKSVSILLSMILFLSILLIPNTNTIAAETIQSTQKHHVTESIVYCTNSVYNSSSGSYDSYLVTENDEVYVIQTYESNIDNWLVALIDDKGNIDIKDDEVIDIYLLDEYIFNNN